MYCHKLGKNFKTVREGAALLSDVNTTKKELQNFDAKQSVVPVIEGIGKAVLKAADVLQNVHQSVQSDLAKVSVQNK